MSEMVDRVAMAVHDALGNPEDIEAKAGCLEIARAVIAAMREPTEAMVMSAPFSYDFGEGDKWSVRVLWRRMIDEALKDG